MSVATSESRQAMGNTAAAGFKKLSRGLVIALAAAVALVSYNIEIPAGKSSAGNWKFAAAHPTILLHIIVATAILVGAAVMLIMAVRNRDRSWIILSVAGLAFVLLAFASGEQYVMTLRKSALNDMSIGWAGAAITYGTGWYLGRKKARLEQDALASRT
jgi:hypothetical protein